MEKVPMPHLKPDASLVLLNSVVQDFPDVQSTSLTDAICASSIAE
jgi:hypothetical protein